MPNNITEKKSSKKLYIICGVIVAIALIFYFISTGKPTDNTSSIEGGASPEATDAQLAGAKVLTLLNQINSLRIDQSLFQSAAYKSLVDYSIAIPELPIGRPNPFAP